MRTMFWADTIAIELKKRKLPLEWVDDMKTPSGKIHVGALRGVVVHDLVYKALRDSGVKATYTYIFDDHDPMDGLPVYLPKEYEKYLGLPLFKIPSPEKGYKSYAEYYAKDFEKVFNDIGCFPEISWASQMYLSGKMNGVIKECLDAATKIREIYEDIYKKEVSKTWYPFKICCPKCGKIATTDIDNWNGETVHVICRDLTWTKGCGFEGNLTPFSNKNHFAGKLPWKVEWAAKWKVIGVTVEGAGKDHMSKGGSHDLASLISEKVLAYPVPYPVFYEWFLIGGRKMSTSKGVGVTASEMTEILPPELLRFLMVKTKKEQQINFDPSGETIPSLFDAYQEAAEAYFTKSNSDLARIFELSQVNDIKKPPMVRFSQLAQWVQSPNMHEMIKKEKADEWIPYVKIWLERFAPDEVKFSVLDKSPDVKVKLTEGQIQFLKKILLELEHKWEPEELQQMLFDWAKENNISSKDGFSAIYLSLIGKSYGPKAGWLLLENSTVAKSRFKEIIDISE